MQNRHSKVVLSFLFLLTIPCVGISQTKSDREAANLIGTVKTVSERLARYGESETEPRDTVTYDRMGNEIERVMISDFGEPIGRQTRLFDTSGFLEKTVYVGADGKPR